MAINKVVYGGETLIDLTQDTVTPETLAEGVTAHNKSGAVITGTMTGGGGDAPSIDGIPSGYARCDYIKFNVEQVVDTGIICNRNTKIQVAFTRERSAQHYLFGVASSDNTASVTAYLGGSWRFGNKYATKSPNTNGDMIYSCILSSSQITMTNSATSISSVNDFETIGSLLIGTCRSSEGEIGNAQFQGKMFYFSMWQGEDQVLKLVPIVSADGVYRFFDMVSKSFFDSITDVPLDGGNL